MSTLYRFKIPAIIVITFLVLFVSCKRTEITAPESVPAGTPVDDQEQVTASLAGVVLDENNMPLTGATVTSGTATVNTDAKGMFKFDNISLSKNNGSVTVTKTGYFKGVRSFKTTAGKSHQVRIQLMQKVLSGTINAAAGGVINTNDGAKIQFPSNAFVTNAGAIYTGNVNVYSRWIDPTAANLPFIVPGDLRGINSSGAENLLETYGMVGAELEDANGNILKIAPGKKAQINFPIPARLLASAPAEIALWHFDDVAARWKENGKAIKSGSIYSAQVDKFSFWNCDGAIDFVILDFYLLNASAHAPFVATSTRIKRVSTGSYGYGISNSEGFTSGAVPRNEPLILEVISSCGNVVYSQNIGPFTTNTSLGNINISLPASESVIFTGKLLNCGGTKVSNGFVSFYARNTSGLIVSFSSIVQIDTSGAFSFSVLNCGNDIAYSIVGVDNSTNMESLVLSGVVAQGVADLGNIAACTSSSQDDIYVAGYEFTAIGGFSVAKVWKNGIGISLTGGTSDAIARSVYVSGNDVYVAGDEKNGAGNSVAKLWKNGIAENLTDGSRTASAFSVFVSGLNVYVAGMEKNTAGVYVAKVWKNGIPEVWSDGIQSATLTSLCVSGNDIYAVGWGGLNSPVAKIWKNGVATILSNNSQSLIANSVSVSGADVYVAGGNANSDGRAMLWKNGVLTYLTDGTRKASAYSVYASPANDVYVAGYEKDAAGKSIAKIWKNGIEIPLPDTSPNFVGATAFSVHVAGNVIYATGPGYATYSLSSAKIWRNGLMTNLTDGTKEVVPKSIFVK